MTRAGMLITIDTAEALDKISLLLKEVEESGRYVRIFRGGKVIAEIRPARTGTDPLRQHSELQGVQFREDPVAPLDEDEWPTELR